MELETLKSFDDEIEDGELSDDSDGYTPLPRPDIPKPVDVPILAVSGTSKMDEALEESVTSSSDTSTDSDDVSKVMKKQKLKKTKRTMMVRVKPMDELQDKKTRFKKYNIWTASLQEDSLMENMRGIDVAKGRGPRDRNVENYDYSLKYRLNGENGLKRRLSNSGDDNSDGSYNQPQKRGKFNGPRRPVKERLGRRKSSSSCESQNDPRIILDLNLELRNDPVEVARDIANKLYEEKDDLLVRIVETLGIDLPIELFMETQRIEKDGGMMIMNGNRRRTPGGVFLFLLKHNDTITQEQRKLIFCDERKNAVKEQRKMQASKRDQKVEELKKRLSEKEKHLRPQSGKNSSSSSESKTENLGNLSNPPPSPVGQEHSPEYKSHAINHVSDASPQKASTSKSNNDEGILLTSYDDDFLDMNCDDMDMF